MREIKWTTEHTLSVDQLQKMILQKVERARLDAEARKTAFKSKLHA